MMAQAKMSSFDTILAWAIVAGAIAGILIRPGELPEAVWACLGALLLVVCRLVSPSHAAGAVAKGTDVYLFLAGMMLLAELARRYGVFVWLAGLAVHAARGSAARLFALIYAVGVLVTVFLSNDATAVVLTPAVYAAIRKARADPPPYLFVCAFIANAASFALPISNPANLVVYGKELPPLLPWLRTFLLPSVCSIAATYAALRWTSRKQVRGGIPDGSDTSRLSPEGSRAAWGIVGSGAVLITASGLGLNLGLPTCAAALFAVVLTTRMHMPALRDIASGVSWSVIPLVAGLFVLVEALSHAGGLAGISHFLEACAAIPHAAGGLAASFGIAMISNVMNNLPSGLLAGSALEAAHIPPFIRDSVLIGVDLGPNLSVTGSLATVLWLIALRREGIQISAWQFLKVGAIVMPPALALAALAISFLPR